MAFQLPTQQDRRTSGSVPDSGFARLVRKNYRERQFSCECDEHELFVWISPATDGKDRTIASAADNHRTGRKMPDCGVLIRSGALNFRGNSENWKIIGSKITRVYSGAAL
jgi:hypothetical protein